MTFDIDLLWNVVYVLVFDIPPPLVIDWFDPWSIICVLVQRNVYRLKHIRNNPHHVNERSSFPKIHLNHVPFCAMGFLYNDFTFF